MATDGSAASAVIQGPEPGSRGVASSRHRLTWRRGGINDRCRKGCCWKFRTRAPDPLPTLDPWT